MSKNKSSSVVLGAGLLLTAACGPKAPPEDPEPRVACDPMPPEAYEYVRTAPRITPEAFAKLDMDAGIIVEVISQRVFGTEGKPMIDDRFLPHGCVPRRLTLTVVMRGTLRESQAQLSAVGFEVGGKIEALDGSEAFLGGVVSPSRLSAAACSLADIDFSTDGSRAAQERRICRGDGPAPGADAPPWIDRDGRGEGVCKMPYLAGAVTPILPPDRPAGGRLTVMHLATTSRGILVRSSIFLTAWLACSSGTRKTVHADLELAKRYERGDGVPRDFRLAARLFEKACDQGRGDASACRRLAVAMARGRGLPKQRRALALMRHACERGDWLACGPYDSFDVAKAEAACGGQEPEACVPLASMLAWSQSGTVEEEMVELLARACQRSVLEACLRLVETHGNEAATEVPFAIERVRAACRQGDSDACAAAGTPIPARELCAAGDFEAC
ncbi:MAG: sel1 repeat family protein [Kofleriaceae bacterium]|nr:sel1 repeat family protein [Kofleriaceae bacterium]MBP9167043.1 sel1 repeat family protein [Kofleriaceae bacterium]MBP9860243.1 sel1 repeat family protein [Kofleriaceae bacterium]